MRISERRLSRRISLIVIAQLLLYLLKLSRGKMTEYLSTLDQLKVLVLATSLNHPTKIPLSVLVISLRARHTQIKSNSKPLLETFIHSQN